MKNVFPLLLLSLLALSSLHSIAQPICGFDGANAKMKITDPQYKLNVERANNSIRTYLQQHPELLIRRNDRKVVTSSGHPQTLSSSYQIPVVVHVIHTGGDVGTIYNPSDAQILGAISYLNQVYNGTWSTNDHSALSAGDLGIQFVLAKRDPNCNPTNGINRVDGSGVSGYVLGGVMANNTTGGADEVNVKSLSRWSNTQYYNIWIVNKIDGNDGSFGQFIAGYAYFPGSNANVDGIVMLATQMIAGQKTLPHEIGHAFNLFHPFNLQPTDPGPCPANTDCTQDGDQVCDTDPIAENISGGVIDFHCRTGLANPCNSNALFTIATESNYMNYTDCYTLFTPGQAARMQAAAVNTIRANLTTSLGGTAPGGGCTPKLDFELQGDRQTETTSGTSGCRNYKDYSYNMVVGVGPSATATATLTVTGGTAVKGLDFDLTTNGSFTSPSTQLTFAAGSTTSQPFTIRIYDDASVNGTRTATLGFTLNNGGGNAAIGDGRPNFVLTIDDNDIAPTGGATPYGTVAAGLNQGTTNLPPFDATQTAQRTQFQYKASELTAAGIPAGTLSGLSLNISSKQTTRPFTNFNIKLGTTTAPYLVDNNGAFGTSGSSMTVVKTISSYTTKAGWNNFTFDVPYTWNGTSNLVVEICYDEGSSSSTSGIDYPALYYDGATNPNGSANQGNMIWQTGVNCWEGFSSLTYTNIKPYIQFTYGTPATLVQTAVSSTQSQYLGPNADVYFYDQVSGQLMARIQNLSSFDYGCTQVVLDRAGSSATAFWNNTSANYLMDKTFHVIPTTNNASGSYNITLYYTQAEVQGWQTATGQTLSAVQLVKVPGQISSVTPSTPTAAGTPTIVTPTISALGLNTGLTYNFTNGFSGFGAGVPSLTALPITLLDFTGRLDNSNAVLNWSTSSEQNSAGFEIDRSFDGQHFSKIGYVPAAGNSSTEKDYTFTDPSLVTDSNFYQLKEITLDGRTTYSKIVLVRDPHATPGFTAVPNPFSSSLEIVFGHVPTGPVQIRVLDITGRQLWRQSAVQSDGGRLQLGLSAASLAPGVYLLEVRSAAGAEIQRVIKK
ncbi:MAG TPA: zinc-dependent metalloprotease [Puia sp.]